MASKNQQKNTSKNNNVQQSAQDLAEALVILNKNINDLIKVTKDLSSQEEKTGEKRKKRIKDEEDLYKSFGGNASTVFDQIQNTLQNKLQQSNDKIFTYIDSNAKGRKQMEDAKYAAIADRPDLAQANFVASHQDSSVVEILSDVADHNKNLLENINKLQEKFDSGELEMINQKGKRVKLDPTKDYDRDQFQQMIVGMKNDKLNYADIFGAINGTSTTGLNAKIANLFDADMTGNALTRGISNITGGGSTFGSVVGSVASMAGSGGQDGFTNVIKGVVSLGFEQICSALGPGGMILKAIVAVGKHVTEIMDKLGQKAQKELDSAQELIDANKKTDSRLYGLKDASGQNALNFVELATDAINVVGANPLVNSKDLINSISELTNAGIVYNLEQKALWNTMTDKLVSTFDITNDYLLTMIKLKQRELTAEYIGIEAAITRTLNSLFQDSQFMSAQYDSVFRAMTDALSLFDDTSGSMVGYTVEKWLGSLSSVGLSESAVNNLSTAINALLTGNLNGLNEQSTTLLAMGARNAGLSISDLLVNGGTATEINEILKSSVEMLQEIYLSNKENHVVLSEWGNILNLTTQDWVAINNLTSETIAQLYQDQTTINDILDEEKFLETQLVSERTLTSERIDNVIENALFRTGWSIATNAEDYTNWKMRDIKQELTDMMGIGLFSDIRSFFNKWAKGLTSLSNGIGDALTVMSNASTYAQATSYAQFYDSTALENSIYGQLFNLNFQDQVAATIPKWEELKNGSYTATGGSINVNVNTDLDKIQTASSTTAYESSNNVGTNGESTNAESGPQEITNSEDATVNEYSDYNVSDIYRALFVNKVPIKVRIAGAISSFVSNVMEYNDVMGEDEMGQEDMADTDEAINEMTT